MLCVMMLPLVVVGCTSKQSVSQCVDHHRLQRGYAASPTGRHRWAGLFHPQREADHCAKQLEGTPEMHINEQLQIGAYRWATHTIIVSNTRASSGV